MIRVKFAYKSNKPRLVVEHAFPLMGLIGLSANITFCGSGGIMSTARTELPYPCISQANSRFETSQREKEYDGLQSWVNYHIAIGAHVQFFKRDLQSLKYFYRSCTFLNGDI